MRKSSNLRPSNLGRIWFSSCKKLPRHCLTWSLVLISLLGVMAPIRVLPVHATGTGPTAAFDYTMPDRFGLDKNGDGLIDYNYSNAFINPSQWEVDLDACASSGGGSGIVRYSWDLGAGALGDRVSTTCHMSAEFPALGTYHVRLSITTQDGQTASATHDVTVRDLLIVSIGDSLASGEGNPDHPQQLSCSSAGCVQTVPPIWENKKCHRSASAGSAQAALAIEHADPKTSVTFIHLACSGAGIAAGL